MKSDWTSPWTKLGDFLQTRVLMVILATFVKLLSAWSQILIVQLYNPVNWLITSDKECLSVFSFTVCKKSTSSSPGLVDFAIGPANSALNLLNGQVMFLGEFKLQKNCIQSCSTKKELGLVKMTLRLVHTSNRQAVKRLKLTFFAPGFTLSFLLNFT